MSTEKLYNTGLYGYSIGYVRSYNTFAKLANTLPHGSGINNEWRIQEYKTHPNRFECINCFSAMNENGYYCHYYDFKVIIDYNPIDNTFQVVKVTFYGQKEKSCCGYGLFDYIIDLMYESFTDWSK